MSTARVPLPVICDVPHLTPAVRGVQQKDPREGRESCSHK